MITEDQLAELERLRRNEVQDGWVIVGSSGSRYLIALQEAAVDLLATIRELRAENERLRKELGV